MTEPESIDEDHEEIVEWLTELDHIFSSPKKPLHESRISQLLNSIESHKYYSTYKHEFLYYSGLSALARNDFSYALKKLKSASQKCKLVTAGETQNKIAQLLVILRLMTNNKISYDHLNAEIRMIIESEAQSLELKPAPDQYHSTENIDSNLQRTTSKESYLAKIMDEIRRFNTEGYCRYEGIEAQQYNPFKKLDVLISEIYALYNKNANVQDSKESRMQRAINQLMRTGRANYPIKRKLVTLHQYTAADVFDEITFSSIASFCAVSNIDAPNIVKLAYDREILTLISNAVNSPGRSRS